VPTVRRPSWVRDAGGLAVWLGVALLVVVTTRSAGWQPPFIDPDDPLPCEMRVDGCPADVAAASTALWWWSLVPVAVVLVGAVVSAASRPAEPAAPGGQPSPALHLGAAGAGAAVLSVLGVGPLLVSVVVSPHTELVVVVLGWLVVAWFLRVVDGAIGPHGVAPRRRALDALAVAAVALAVWTWRAHTAPGGLPAIAAAAGTVALAVVACTALALLLRRPTGRRAAVALPVVAVLSVAAAVVTTTRPSDVVAAPPVVADPAPSTPPGLPADGASPATDPVPTAPPTGVDVDVPCTPADLALTVGGFDAALGARAASVVATNTGTTPCLLVGTPTVTLLQGGRPLQLTVEPGRDPSGNPAVVVPVGLAPGAAAFVLLGWRTYGGWADAGTPQSVTVDLGSGAVPAALPTDLGPAPFDVADGGTWEIAPWALLVR